MQRQSRPLGAGRPALGRQAIAALVAPLDRVDGLEPSLGCRHLPSNRPRLQSIHSPMCSRPSIARSRCGASTCMDSTTPRSWPCSKPRRDTRWTISGVVLAHALHRETDGNPFFTREILRHLAETGAISQRADGRWIAEVDFRGHGSLPTSVREVIGRRVARLGEETEQALQRCCRHRPRLRTRPPRRRHRPERRPPSRPARCRNPRRLDPGGAAATGTTLVLARAHRTHAL